MNQQTDPKQKRKFLFAVFGLGLIFTLLWSMVLAFVPPGQALNIINWLLYFMSVSIIALPTFAVLKLSVGLVYSIALAVVIWAIWVFGVKYLFTLFFLSIRS